MYSVQSQATVDTLASIELQLAQMTFKVDEAVKTLDEPAADGIDPQLRGDLAQLHGDANKLLATRIDAILTGELHSGKEDARAKRKHLTQTTEALIVKIEDSVKRYDAFKKA